MLLLLDGDVCSLNNNDENDNSDNNDDHDNDDSNDDNGNGDSNDGEKIL